MVIELLALRDRTYVFRDRAHAGALLADLLAPEAPERPLVLAIPAGGVPVAAALCRRWGWPLGCAVVSKITPAWDSEVGYGAVAFDGTVQIDRARATALGLSAAEIEAGTERTRRKVVARMRALCGEQPLPLSGRAAILVDDGIASGTTLRVALDAVRRAGAGRLVVAVPTAHVDAAETIARAADGVYVANLRGGHRFAVADAYREWHDVSQDELTRNLDELGAYPPIGPPA